MRACLKFALVVYFITIFERNETEFAEIAGSYLEKSNKIAAKNK
jgi:hypothetical protein